MAANVGNASAAAGVLALTGAAIHLLAMTVVDQATVLAFTGAEGGKGFRGQAIN
jgi:hypothetical protein